ADVAAGAVGLGLVLLMMALKNQGSGPTRPILTPSNPTSLTPATPKDDKAGKASQAAPSTDAGQDLSPGPGGVVISDNRRKHILDGDANGSGGGHGPGRNRPNKTEFPPDWSDDRVIDDIRDVANDPASSRETEPDGRIKATGSRDGVDIRVIVEADKKTVVTGASLKSIPVNHAQVREYIDVQEFGLALDLLAHIQLKSGKPVPSDTMRIFEALATRMGMKAGDEWRGVAEIRAAR
ncbi:MAG: hypothetical protein Q9211_007157, partial [Gyalolechia sp. 1 TL-2023]